jgi:hypothetical protein
MRAISMAAGTSSGTSAPSIASHSTVSSATPISRALAPLSRPSFARRLGGGLTIASAQDTALRAPSESRTVSPLQTKHSRSPSTARPVISALGKCRLISPRRISSLLSSNARTSPASLPTSA